MKFNQGAPFHRSVPIILLLCLLSLTAQAAVRVWDGGSTRGNGWRDRFNWQGDTAPQVSDHLVFPSGGVPKTVNTNDYPNNTRFASITLQANYSLFGNDIVILEGITNASGTSSLSMDTRLVGDLVFEAGNRANRLNYTGNITIGRDLTLSTVGGTAVTLTGEIIGPGDIVNSCRLLTMTEDSPSFTGVLTLPQNFSEARVNGQVPLMAVSVERGSLTGLGQVGRVTVSGGTLAPGSTSGTLTMDRLLAETDASIDFLVSTDPSEASDLITRGSITLNEPQLSLSVALPFKPELGDTFLLMDNNGTDPISGQFRDLRDGQRLEADGAFFRISYRGGDGNDVVLIAISPETGVTRVWDGGGSDNLWRTPENWVGDNRPEEGDDLRFPKGVLQLTNVNDYAAGTVFNSLTFVGTNFIRGRYTLQGSEIALNQGITHNHNFSFDPVLIETPLRLVYDQTFNVISNSGFLIISNRINTAGNRLTIRDRINLNGRITGSGGIRKLGPQKSQLWATNTFTGPVDVLEGTLDHWFRPMGLGSPAGRTFVADGATIESSFRGTNDEPVLLEGRMRFTFGVSTQGWTAPITISGNEAVMGVQNRGAAMRVSHLAGSGQVLKNETGDLTLVGTHDFDGALTLGQGSVTLDGDMTNTLLVVTNGLLHAKGEIGGLETTGDGERQIRVATSGTGRMSSRGLVRLNPGAVFQPRLHGTVPVSSYDQLVIQSTGALDLNDATLDVLLDFFPVVSTTFLLIDKQSGGPIQGTFMGLPEDSSFTTITGTEFHITYLGGDGNDVVLTVLSQSGLAARRIWDGNGVTSLWSDGDNWVGNIAPNPGDDLIFPLQAISIPITNDLPVATSFNALYMNGRGFNLYGNKVFLNNGIQATNNQGFTLNFITMPLGLAVDQTFLVTTQNSVWVQSEIDTNGRDLNARSEGGDLRFQGVISGAGGLIKTGPGEVYMGSLDPHTYSGVTDVQEGRLIQERKGNLGDTNAPTIVREGAVLENSSIGFNDIPEPLELWGTLENDRNSGTWAGSIHLPGTNAVIRGARSSSRITVNGNITGPGGLTIGGVQCTLNGPSNTYSGLTLVTNLGHSTFFTVNGKILNSPIMITPFITMRGTGTVDQLSLDRATLQPFAFDINSMTVMGDLLMQNNSRLEVRSSRMDESILAYSGLRVFGAITLEDTSLGVNNLEGFDPPFGQPLFIIENLGANPVQGIFRNRPENSLSGNFSSGLLMQIKYTGGDGNDVTLTRVRPPSEINQLVCLPNGTKVVEGTGLPGLLYTLEATTNLNPPRVWIQIDSDAADGSGQYQLNDPDAPNHPMRYYRVRSP